jgi:hypothetical protein
VKGSDVAGQPQQDRPADQQRRELAALFRAGSTERRLALRALIDGPEGLDEIFTAARRFLRFPDPAAVTAGVQ